MKGRTVVIFLIPVLVSMVLFSGCKKGEEYVEGLDGKLAQAERLEDEVLVRALDGAVAALALESFPGDAPLNWENIKEQLDNGSCAYLESLGADSYSNRTLQASLRQGGWIKIRQGWIVIAKDERYRFTYRTEEP